MILRRALAVRPAPEAFVTPCRKVVFSFCEHGGSSKGMRSFLASNGVEGASSGGLGAVANEHKAVEMVVLNRPNRHPHVTGLYANGRDKSICVRNMDVNQIRNKVKLLLASSGGKIVPIRRPKVESTTPSPRGIWSPFHERL